MLVATENLMELKMKQWMVAIPVTIMIFSFIFPRCKFASTETKIDCISKAQNGEFKKNDNIMFNTSASPSSMKDLMNMERTIPGTTSHAQVIVVLEVDNNPEFSNENCNIVQPHLGIQLSPIKYLGEMRECRSKYFGLGNLLSGIFMTKLLALSVSGNYTFSCGGNDGSNILYQLAPILSNDSSMIPVLANFSDICTECTTVGRTSVFLHSCPYGLNWAVPIIQQDLQSWAWQYQSEVKDLDDVAIHFRCGDVLSFGGSFMGFPAFDTYARMLSSEDNASIASIGIVTSSLEPSHCRSHNCEHDHLQDCRIVLQGLVDFLQDHFPGIPVHVRNSINETLGTAFLRLILAKVTLCPAPSTFCLYPAIAAFGQSHILYERELNPFVEHIDTVTLFPNVHIYKVPILTTHVIKSWKNQTGAAIVEWQHQREYETV